MGCILTDRDGILGFVKGLGMFRLCMVRECTSPNGVDEVYTDLFLKRGLELCVL